MADLTHNLSTKSLHIINRLKLQVTFHSKLIFRMLLIVNRLRLLIMFHSKLISRMLLIISKLTLRILHIISNHKLKLLCKLITSRIHIIREMKMFSNKPLNQSSNLFKHYKELPRFIALSVVQLITSMHLTVIAVEHHFTSYKVSILQRFKSLFIRKSGLKNSSLYCTINTAELFRSAKCLRSSAG